MTKRIINKRIRTGVLAAAVAGGSILGLGQIGTVSAQVDDGDGEPAEEPVEGERPEREGRRGGQHVEALAELLGMDVDALREALRSGSTIADVAADQGVPVDTVVDAIVDSQTERIEGAVDEGRITQEQADERLATLEEQVTTRVNEGRPERGDGEGRRGARGGQNLEALAEVLGTDVESLREAYQSGATIADVAAEQGVPIDTVIDSIVDSKTERLDAAVEEGRLTQEEADEKAAELEDRVATRVNEGRPERGAGDGQGFGPRGQRGPGGGQGGPAPVDADA